MAAALPGATADSNAEAPATSGGLKAVTSDGRNPQEFGWAPPTKYDYTSYNMSNKELRQARAPNPADGETIHNPTNYQIPAEGDVHSNLAPAGEWASNATVYEWEDEYGDIGPRFEPLEKQLFGDENHVKTGLKFSA